MKLLKADALGFSRVDSSGMTEEHLAEYESEGYRQVSDLEFELAFLVSKYGTAQIVRLASELSAEFNNTLCR